MKKLKIEIPYKENAAILGLSEQDQWVECIKKLREFYQLPMDTTGIQVLQGM